MQTGAARALYGRYIRWLAGKIDESGSLELFAKTTEKLKGEHFTRLARGRGGRDGGSSRHRLDGCSPVLHRGRGCRQVAERGLDRCSAHRARRRDGW